MRVADLDYELPDGLVARHPCDARDGARMLVVGEDGPEDASVVDLAERIPAGALLVVNDTRVLKARVFGAKRATGGRVEALMVRAVEAGESGERWHALLKSSKPVRQGALLDMDGGLELEVVGRTDDGAFVVLAKAEGGVLGALDRAGVVPLPPYLRRSAEEADDDRYQTVYAARPGAVAAPTAGLHFSASLLAALEARGVERASVTLHVGPGTFRPVSHDDLDEHPMHAEWIDVPEATAAAIDAARARKAPVVAVGTTVVRALESAADTQRLGAVRPFRGDTRLLIQPGYRFAVIDALVTNFHLPRSTLLALVYAFGGTERVRAAYTHAIAAGYRFYSYGDAMFLPHRARRP